MFLDVCVFGMFAPRFEYFMYGFYFHFNNLRFIGSGVPISSVNRRQSPGTSCLIQTNVVLQLNIIVFA